MCRCMSIAFLLAHVALVAFVVSMATNYWFIKDPNHQHDQHQNTSSCHKGLFEICCPYGDCKYGAEYVFNTTEVQTYYRVSQFLYGFSGLNCLMAIILFYTSLMSKKCYNSVCVSGWISAELAISALEGVIAIVLLGTNQESDKGFPKELDICFGWSMFVAMGAIFMVIVALFANVLHNCKMHRETKRAQYERI